MVLLVKPPSTNPSTKETRGSCLNFDRSTWERVKQLILDTKDDSGPLKSYISDVRFLESQGTQDRPRFVLAVGSDLLRYLLIESYTEQIYKAFSQVCSTAFEVDIVVQKSDVVNTAASSISPEKDSVTTSTQNPQVSDYQNSMTANIQSSQKIPIFQNKNKDLNPEYTFGTFVVGRNTEFVHAACYNVAGSPGAEGYNPLIICGPPGMGKTHLLHAVGNHILLNLPHLRVNYFGAENFLNECISGIRRFEMDKFRQKYRNNADILLVDDIQMIGKTEAVQEEFFHTINSFLDKRKQVIVASDKMPKDILGLEDRNRSRLEWGLIVDIPMPDYETRVSITMYKAEKFGVRLSEDVVSYIARISKRSIRELEGNIRKLKMYSELQGLSINLDLAKKVLASHETNTQISAEDIQKLVADHFNVKMTDMKSTTRSKQIVVPRQVAMFLIKTHLDKSLVEIGRLFGGKDHTTVLNAIERVGFLQSKDLDFKNNLDELTTRIHNITGV